MAACGKTPRDDSVHLPSLGEWAGHGVRREREQRRRCIAKAWDECPGKGENQAWPLGHDRLHEERSIFSSRMYMI